MLIAQAHRPAAAADFDFTKSRKLFDEIGDVEQIITDTGAGFLMQTFDNNEMDALLQALPGILLKDPLQIRMRSEKWYDLKKGIEKYNMSYTDTFS